MEVPEQAQTVLKFLTQLAVQAGFGDGDVQQQLGYGLEPHLHLGVKVLTPHIEALVGRKIEATMVSHKHRAGTVIVVPEHV
ncbi:hypothetical protein J8C02_14805 [Chloracidobacterium sp. MS 40/45]|uniref:hypothetical protein n=1 Tax=Chloracidobacterium aggregatum TaxID=2851959 RepID=UPI001B8D24A8|nr:hypothetical protein [Chloracidobacterium aggregatum]QUW01403.1 hypothetical protein J8C02_14805 [Chloracidobacterium sp. MS 40/45]